VIVAREGAAAGAPPSAGPRLDRDAFNRPTLRVARDLLGKFLVRDGAGRRLAAMIAETEAYKGPRDRASHAWGGRRTPRVEALYADGGIVYVYFVYGMHWMLNFSTAGRGKPEAILVRGVVLESASAREVVSGPGRVCARLGIDGSLYGEDATRSERIWIEDRGVRVPARRVVAGPRVGIGYAGTYWAARPWRFRIAAEDGDHPPARGRARAKR
jgi:DNA-3-methyladenine glycosylase